MSRPITPVKLPEGITLLRMRSVKTTKPSTRLRCLCLCYCGRKFFVWKHHLNSGNTASCGCKRNTQSGAKAFKFGRTSVSPHLRAEYSRWNTMHQRCENPNNPQYKNYGARGIRVCERWGVFEYYLEDIAPLGPCPAGCSIDRINNDGNYEPGNVRWATASEQSLNRRKK